MWQPVPLNQGGRNGYFKPKRAEEGIESHIITACGVDAFMRSIAWRPSLRFLYPSDETAIGSRTSALRIKLQFDRSAILPQPGTNGVDGLDLPPADGVAFA